MICKKCGKELPDTAKFCGGCGTPTKSAEVEAVVESTGAGKAQFAASESAASEETAADTVERDQPKEEASADALATQAADASGEKANASKGFVAAGSGANPFAAMTSKLNSQLDQANASANTTPFDGKYAQNAEADDIAVKARKTAEERAARRAEKREKTEQRRGKKPVIAGFAEEPEEDEKQVSPLAEALPDWDLLPTSGFFVDRTVS